MHITILDDYQDAVRRLRCFERLGAHRVTVYNDTVKDLDTLARRLAEAEALVLIRQRTSIPAALVERLPRLRFIAQTGGKAPHIDLAACTRAGVAVALAGSGQQSFATAELTWGLILCALRALPYEIERLKAGHWQSTMGRALRGRTLGIFGYGRLGKVVAGYGRAFGMRVLVWGRQSTLDKARADNYECADSQASLFEQCDIVSLHVELNPGTEGIVTAGDLARMKSDALLVNTSRAGLIPPGVLEAALRQGRPGYAAVDVFEDEPVLGATHPLLHMPNVICTPHLGYVEWDNYERLLGGAFEQLLAWAAGTPGKLLNPEVLGRAARR